MNATNTSFPASTERAIAAIFRDHANAVRAFELLKAQGFAHPWLALTKPSDAERVVAPATTPPSGPSQNDVAESSDGALGAIGRFFSGEGNSLRRSLEDHGLDPADAADIDDRLPPSGAIVTVYGEGRGDLAAQILRDNDGRLSGSPTLWDAPGGGPDSQAESLITTSRTLVNTVPLAGIPGAYEEIFIERRTIVPGPTPATRPASSGASTAAMPLDGPRERESLGLNDLL
jgi:hypothetical protein